jgi:hypothetical protein
LNRAGFVDIAVKTARSPSFKVRDCSGVILRPLSDMEGWPRKARPRERLERDKTRGKFLDSFVFLVTCTGSPAASLAGRSDLSRSQLLEKAFSSVARSIMASSASTCRESFHASRTSLVIGVGGTYSPGQQGGSP